MLQPFFRYLTLYRAAAISVQGQLAGRHAILLHRLVEQRLEQGGAFGVGDLPSDDAAAEYIKDNIEIEIIPFSRAFEFRQFNSEVPQGAGWRKLLAGF